jgi:hypothetical protein
MSPDPGPGRNIGLKPLKRLARGSAPCPSRVYRRPNRLGRAAFGLRQPKGNGSDDVAARRREGAKPTPSKGKAA